MASAKLENAIRTAYIQLSIQNAIPEDGVKISSKKNFDTACWSFLNNLHNIY